MKKTAIAVVLPTVVLLGLSACVHLSPAGDRVQLLDAGEVARVSSCRQVGTVTVSSPDALRNATAALEGDTALMQRVNGATGQFVKGTVYACRPAPEAPVAVPVLPAAVPAAPAAAEPPLPAPEAARKSGICQSRGGRWTGSLCVIDID